MQLRTFVTGITKRIAWTLLGLLLGVALTAAAGPHPETLAQKLDLLAEVLAAIENHYVDISDPTRLIEGAARGAVATLDPHSVFFPAAEYRELLSATEGEYAGIGIELGLQGERLEIMTVFDGSPAQHAGLQVGDELIAVNDNPVAEMAFGEVQERLRGPVDSKISLTVRHPHRSDVWNYTLVRSWIRVVPLVHRTLGDGIELIHVKSFARRVTVDLEAQLARTPPTRGLILDLRGNPGGLFDEAVAMCDLFLKDGPIVSATGRNGRLLEQQQAHTRGNEPSYPVAVLIDGGSASAAEIVAGALHDRGRARLFGQKSYGKGSVQSIIDLSDGSGLKLTVARYQTPSGRTIDGTGIEPDERIESESEADAEHVVTRAAAWLKTAATKR